jgi:hypothetical protein
MTPKQRAAGIADSFALHSDDHPPRWGKRLEACIEAEIEAAAAAEREECARLAEAECDAWEAEGDGESVLASQGLYGMAEAGRQIAAAIRASG